MRALPPDLVVALERARELEVIALESSGPRGQRRAIQGTSAQILAAVNLGWQLVELAAALGLTRQAVGKRLQSARQLYGDNVPALVIDAPLDHPPHRRASLATAVEDREWLTRDEAASFACVHPFTIRNWQKAGLLPNTDRTHLPHLMLRADLVRVLRAARYKEHGVHYAMLQLQLSLDGNLTAAQPPRCSN